MEVEPSHVLRLLGSPTTLPTAAFDWLLRGSTTAAEIEFTVGEVVREVLRLRALSLQYQLWMLRN